MAAFRTGDTLVWIIGPVLDDSGAAVTGASFSAVSALKPDGTSFSPTYTEIGSGVYKATFVSTARGLWFLYSQATVSGVVYADSGSITVDDELAYMASGSAGTVGAALANLDAAISSRASTAAVTAAKITVTGPVVSGGDISLIQGDDYLNADGRPLTWTSSSWPVLTSGSAVFTIFALLTGTAVKTKSMVIVNATTVRVDLTATETAALAIGGYRFTIVATLADASIATLVDAGVTVRKAGS